MARVIPTAFGGVIVARNRLPGKESNKSKWPHGGSRAKRAVGGNQWPLCSCSEDHWRWADSGGLRPSRFASGARLARLALNLLPLYEVDALPSATTLLRSATPAARRLARG